MPNAPLPNLNQDPSTEIGLDQNQTSQNPANNQTQQVYQQPEQQAQPAQQTPPPQLTQSTEQAQQPQPSQPNSQAQPTQDRQPTQANQPSQDNQPTHTQQPAQDEPYPDVRLEESRIAPGMYRPIPEETVLEWEAPSRPFKKHNKKYFSTVAIISLLVSLILGFAGQLVAITVVISIAFLVYVLSVIPPQDITYKITTYGIRVEKNLYYWEELGSFWFDKKYNQALLNIASFRFPGRVTLMLGDQDQEIVKMILSEVLLHKKPELTLYEKTSAWLQEKIPLDVES